MQMHHHHHHHVHVLPSTLPSHSDEPVPVAPSSSIPLAPLAPQPPSRRRPRTLTPPPSSSPDKKRHKSLRTALRSLPIFTPAAACHFPSVRASRTTGTLFGHGQGPHHPRHPGLPGTGPLILELATPAGKFLQEMGSGKHIRIALECEKVAEHKKSTTTTERRRQRRRLLEEPLWTAYINRREIGYAVWREPTEDDRTVMQLLHTVSVGLGVLPSNVVMDPATTGDGDLA